MARAAGVLRGSKALKLRGTRLFTVVEPRGFCLTSLSHICHTRKCTLHRFPSLQQLPLTALGPPLLQMSQSQPVPNPRGCFWLQLAARSASAHRDAGPGLLLQQQCAVPTGDSRGLYASSTWTVFAVLRQMETGCTFLTPSLFPVDPVPRSHHIYLCSRKDQARFYKAHSRSLVYQRAVSQLRRI